MRLLRVMCTALLGDIGGARDGPPMFPRPPPLMRPPPQTNIASDEVQTGGQTSASPPPLAHIGSDEVQSGGQTSASPATQNDADGSNASASPDQLSSSLSAPSEDNSLSQPDPLEQALLAKSGGQVCFDASERNNTNADPTCPCVAYEDLPHNHLGDGKKRSIILLPNDLFKNDTKMYPREPGFGTYCGAHDMGTGPLCKKENACDLTATKWCCYSWCFIHEACAREHKFFGGDAKRSLVNDRPENSMKKQVYASYVTCNANSIGLHDAHLDWFK